MKFRYLLKLLVLTALIVFSTSYSFELDSAYTFSTTLDVNQLPPIAKCAFFSLEQENNTFIVTLFRTTNEIVIAGDKSWSVSFDDIYKKDIIFDNNRYKISYTFCQKWFDDDDEWEYLIHVVDQESGGAKSIVVDDDNKSVLFTKETDTYHRFDLNFVNGKRLLTLNNTTHSYSHLTNYKIIKSTESSLHSNLELGKLISYNYTHGKLQLSNKTKNEVKVKVVSPIGRVLHHSILESFDNNLISLAGYANGIYFLTISQDDFSTSYVLKF